MARLWKKICNAGKRAAANKQMVVVLVVVMLNGEEGMTEKREREREREREKEKERRFWRARVRMHWIIILVSRGEGKLGNYGILIFVAVSAHIPWISANQCVRVCVCVCGLLVFTHLQARTQTIEFRLLCIFDLRPSFHIPLSIPSASAVITRKGLAN